MIFLELFFEFFKIGLFTIGGGYAMIPLIKEVVLNHNWLNEAEFLDMIGISEVTPGPIAINMATYIGAQQGGLLMGPFGSFLGGLIATFAVILPAFIIMLLISIVLKRIIKNRFVQGALKGIRAVAVALILSAGITLLSDVLFPINIANGNISVSFNKTPVFILLIIAFFSFVLTKVMKKKLQPILVIVVSAVIGIVINYLLILPA